MDISTRLLERRIQLGWEPKEAAFRIGISQQFIGHMESGQKKPSIHTLAKICIAYECTADWLLGLPDAPEPNQGLSTDERYFIREMECEPSPSQPLFGSQKGGDRLAYYGLKQLFRRLRESTGIHFSAHSLRRTFAINSLRNGMDIYTLAKLMGHTDITVLRAYLPLVNSDLRIAQQRFGVVDNL